MNKLIDSILTSNEVETPSGKKIQLHSAISRDEGTLLLDLVRKDPSIHETLEVGCAYGLSSLFIAEGLKTKPNGHHTIIDPFQNGCWEGVGIHNLRKSGFAAFDLIEDRSEFALPAMLKVGESRFDLVFIDGFHTFDHTLLDCFYATRLLRVGGYLVVDDASFPAIRRVIDYLLLYPCFAFERGVSEKCFPAGRHPRLKRRLVKILIKFAPGKYRKKIFSRTLLGKLDSEYQSMVALRKIATDDREWNWYDGDF